MANCILCRRDLSETNMPGMFLHEEAEDCLVRVADSYGVSIDEDYEVVGDDVFYKQDMPLDEGIIHMPTWMPIEEALTKIFAEKGLQRLGGQSTGSGWSNVSLFQKCRYAWKRRYLNRDRNAPSLEGEIVPLSVGTLTHVYLALHYQLMMVPDYPLTPDDVNQKVRELGCNPEIFSEGWRLFSAYRLFYKGEVMVPLAVEMDLVDPRTNHSCRYDLIAYFPDESPGKLPGTYVIEHKTASRFDQNTLEGWLGDGEILGQVDLWERLHLERKFGPLRGVLVNLLGKQKAPQFHRTLAAPSVFAIDNHRVDLRQTNAEIALARASGVWPRSRGNCIGRWGRCEHWDHCNSGEE